MEEPTVHLGQEMVLAPSCPSFSIDGIKVVESDSPPQVSPLSSSSLSSSSESESETLDKISSIKHENNAAVSTPTNQALCVSDTMTMGCCHWLPITGEFETRGEGSSGARVEGTLGINRQQAEPKVLSMVASFDSLTDALSETYTNGIVTYLTKNADEQCLENMAIPLFNNDTKPVLPGGRYRTPCGTITRWTGHQPLAPYPKITKRRPRNLIGAGGLSAASDSIGPSSPPPHPRAAPSSIPISRGVTPNVFDFSTLNNSSQPGTAQHYTPSSPPNTAQKKALSFRNARQSLSVSSTAQLDGGGSPQQCHQPQHQHHHAPIRPLSGVPQIGSPLSAMKDLPPLRNAHPLNREELFMDKVKLCGVIFSFNDNVSYKTEKDMKRQTLLELVSYIDTPSGQKIFTKSVMANIMAMVSANVCRALPPPTDDYDPEEDEPTLEPAWPHLQVVYEFLLRFIVSPEVNAKVAKKYIDRHFCLQLVELFDSEDPRERDYLKIILHRIYGKFMSHRSLIRRAMSHVFYRFIYETERHNGISELLEVLGSIINGFSIPLKEEHSKFLVRVLIPLHKPNCVSLYHRQLSYCIIQYLEKDENTLSPILNGIFKYWPWCCSGKQVLFLNELEEILEMLDPDQLPPISNNLFSKVARFLESDHFQVVERTLFLWNNDHLVNDGCLFHLYARTALPLIYGPLFENSSRHWNVAVEGLAQNVLKMYRECYPVLYEKCKLAYLKKEEKASKKIEKIADRWGAIEEMALKNVKRE